MRGTTFTLKSIQIRSILWLRITIIALQTYLFFFSFFTFLSYSFTLMSDLPIDAIPEAGPQRDKGQYTMDFDNLDAEMAKIPLFMTDLPDEENDTLTALQSLVFDGTPEGIIQKRERINLI